MTASAATSAPSWPDFAARYQRLRQERELLKRAAAFFATENGTR